MVEKYIDINFRLGEQFDYLYELVANSPINVTAIKNKEDFALKHILDSLYFFIKNPLQVTTVLDIGSGGGFPGLVLAIFFPEWKLTLLDSIGKKCRFMDETAKKLQLANVKVVNTRAENYVGTKFDLITARGVGKVKEVLNYSKNSAHEKTSWLMYKGEHLTAELEEASPEIVKRGLKSETIRIEKPFTRTYLYLHP